MTVEGQNYEKILDAMQETGIYVIRADDHRILYLNQWVRRITPLAKPGMVCHELWPGSCSSCPLLTIGDKQESRSVCYSSPFGKVVDILAARVVWGEDIPAFVITLTPHMEASSYIYHRLIRADLTRDAYEVVRLGQQQEAWAYGREEPLSVWLERFVRLGRLHPEDVDRFRSFVRLDHLREGLRTGKKILHCTYRRWINGHFRWNLLEVVPDFGYSNETQLVLLYAKDVHDVLCEGLAREDSSIRRQEIIRALGEQNDSIFVIDLDTGLTDPVRVDGQMQRIDGNRLMDWETELCPRLEAQLHWEYQEIFREQFSLASLRSARKSETPRVELLCQRTVEDDLYSYISINACFNQDRKTRRYVVLALQDSDQRVRQELERSQWDMQMASILKCRYSVMNTVHLDTGLCERIDLRQAASTRDSQSDNYDQHVDRALKTLVAPEDAQTFWNAMSLELIRQRALEIQDYAEDVCQYRTREQPPRWLEQHVVYTRQDGEMMVNILGRDITSEKNQEADRREREQEKMDIIRSLSGMFCATYYIDLRADTYQSVTQLREIGEFLGQRSAYTAGIHSYAARFIHPDDRAEYLETMSIENLRKRLGWSRTLLATEYRKLPSDGSIPPSEQCSWIRATAVLIRSDSSGVPLTVLYANQDVTESKQKEAREHQALLDAYQAANHANAAKSDFLSRMSHDIRTPMNGIIGMTNIAVGHINDRERVLDCLHKITVSSRHLLNLVNEVLDMSQIESGKIDLAEERFFISDMISELAIILRSPIQEKGHHLRMDPPEVAHGAVWGDPARLQQVFVNILGNSIKYTPPGGLLEVSVREKESREHGYGCYSFVFRDNGVGMDEAFVQRIFEPFSRAEDSRTGAIEGAGLGMTIAQNIVRMMGGDIAVKSQRGKGTQFTVTLFLKQQGDEAAEDVPGVPAADQDISFCGRRFLLVEDNEINREIACELLQDTGAAVECTENGQEAFDRFAAASPGYYDLILMDIQMPVMNGYDATRAIRSLPRSDALTIPILAMSANAFAEDIAASREAGMNDHITKPFDIFRLMECLRHWLGQPMVR
ncbi:MAG: response regulator [Oscillospiraceae bacterium]|nr:response regulator [Oscillospiraceae bacterium]